MDLQSIDPRAAAPAATGRGGTSSSGGAFQGVMQMMAEIAANRSDRQAVSGSSEPDRDDDRVDEARTDETEEDNATSETDAARSETHDSDANDSDAPAIAVSTDPTPIAVPVAAPAPTSPAPTELAPQSTGDRPISAAAPPVAEAAAPADAAPAAPAPTQAQTEAVDTAAPAPVKPAAEPVVADTRPVQQATTAEPLIKTSAPTDMAAKPAAAPPAETTAVLARAAQQTTPRAEAPDASARTTGATTKPDSGPGRGDALMAAKVTVDTPTPIGRSQGVSSAVLVQAQQAAAQPQAQVQAQGTVTPLHVGANQPTFVGADGASGNQGGNQAGGQNVAGQNAGGQNAGGQNGGNQNNGLGAAQQVGVSFGATIGQRGFGGEAARAQFQQILATRTARAQPAALAAGEAPRALGASSMTSSSTPMTMAGISGPQSTHTSASSVNRAAATAHGRPGATLGTPADQVAVKLSSTANDGGGRVTVRLNPEELGKVDIKMEIAKDGMVRAVVAAEKPETLELLQKDAKALEKALQDAGLQTDGDSLEFDLRGDGGQFAKDAEDGAGKSRSAAADGNDPSDDGDVVANDQDGDGGGVNADGSYDLVA